MIPEIRIAESGPQLSPLAIAMGTAVRLGGRQVLKYHGLSAKQLHTQFKSDKTPVTAADENAERMMVGYVRRMLPKARIYGEETGVTEHGDSATTVYIDPLDGTNAFTHGERYSSVGLAIRENGQTTVAAICLPFSRQLLVAEKGKGAWLYSLEEELTTPQAPKRLEVSKQDTIAGANLYIDANIYPANRHAKLAFFDALADAATPSPYRMTMIGTNIGQQAAVAMGLGDATLTDCVGGPFDLIAGELMITEAGGRFTDLDGNQVTEQTQVALGSNGILHDGLLNLLKPLYEGYSGFRTISQSQ